jgi:diguanylate cyclase (GGDEF)-like protein/PAS domain S-box-containing protein
MKYISGIKQQTMLVALIPIMLMTFLFGSYSIYARFADADAELLKNSNLLAKQLAASSEYPIFSGNLDLLQQGGNATLLQPDIKSILVLDSKFKPLLALSKAHTLPLTLPASVSITQPIYQDHTALLIFEPIVATQINLDDLGLESESKKPPPLGAVIIEFSKKQLNRQKKEMLLINIAVMSGVIILSILAALWLARRITRPIHAIGALIDKIGLGDLSVRIPPQPTVHELNTLARHINRMAQQLADERDSLEQKIQNATENLRKKNELVEKSNQEVHRLNGELSYALNEMESLIEANPDLFYVLNAEGQLIKWNSNLEKFTGLSKHQLLYRNASEFLCTDDRHILDGLLLTIMKSGSATIEARSIRHDGKLVHYLCNGVALKNNEGKIIGFTGTGRDISERIEAAERMRHMAHYDLLTDLPNRAMLSDRLQQALAKANRDKIKMALLFIDLDGFKAINDTYGHDVGDLLLKAATQEMLGCIRESDTLARIGGDEFVVLLPALEKSEDALCVAEKIRLALCQPLIIAEHTIGISSSIGIAIYPEHGNNETDLLKHADDAMYIAKSSGRNLVRLHEITQG